MLLLIFYILAFSSVFLGSSLLTGKGLGMLISLGTVAVLLLKQYKLGNFLNILLVISLLVTAGAYLKRG